MEFERDFTKVKKQAEEIGNLAERIVFLMKYRKDWLDLPNCNRGRSSYNLELERISREISYTEDLIKYKPEVAIETPKPELSINLHEKDGEQPLKKLKRVSYNWIGNHSDIPKLYRAMLTRFILQETTETQFRAIFREEPIENTTPVKWHEDNASELLYFIIRLQEKRKIRQSQQQDYIKLKACFVKPDGTVFSSEFKSLRINLETNLSMDKQKAINDLITSI